MTRRTIPTTKAIPIQTVIRKFRKHVTLRKVYLAERIASVEEKLARARLDLLLLNGEAFEQGSGI